MGHLDRYKKPGGFLQLLELMESFPSAKQQKFMDLVQAENATWAKALKERIITVERIIGWPAATLSEIVPHMPPNIMAMALHGFSKEQMEHFLSGLPASEKRKITTEYDIVKPQPHEIAATHNRLISTVRKLIKEGDLRMDTVDALVIIDENTEKKVINAANNMKADMAPAASAESADSATSASSVEETSDLVEREIRTPSIDAKTMADAKNATALVVSLQKENKSLKAEIKMLKDKLDTIRKIA